MALVGNISGSGGVSNTIGITGSLIIANPGTSTFPSFPGSDVALFVSGNISSKPSTSPNLAVRGTTVFGGDVVISGTLFGGSPLYIGSPVTASSGIYFSGPAATFSTGLSGSLTKLTDGTSFLIAGSNITIATGSSGAITISSTGGGGGGGTNFFLDTAGAGKIYTTASSVAFPLGEAGVTQASDKGTAVTFYVSGSKTSSGRPATGVSVYGGDVQISGSIYLGDGYTNASSIRDQAGANLLYSTNGSWVGLGKDVLLVTNIIKSSDALTVLTLNAGGTADATFAGNVTGSNVLLTGDIAVNGGDVTTTSATATLFNSNATTVTIAGGATTSTTIGNATGGVTLNGNATVTGDLAVNGATSADITTTTATATIFNNTATTVNIAGGATAVNIGSGAGTVTIPGNLTVNGTTTTVNTTNLVVRDPLIYFGSGSSTSNQPGGIALASGSSVPNQALVWGRVANDVWGAGRLDVTAGTTTDVSAMTFLPVRASKFETGGPNAYISSSNGNALIVNSQASNPISFTFGGTSFAELLESGVDARFGATGAKNLILSGASSVALVAGVNGTIFQRDTNVVGSMTGIGATSMTLAAATAAGAATSLVLTGSGITLGANNNTTDFLFAGVGRGVASNNNGFTLGSQPGINLNLSGSNNFFMRHGNSGIGFQQNSISYMTINSGSVPLSSNTALIISDPGKSMLVGGSSTTIVSGSDIFLDAAANGVTLRKDSTSFAQISSPSANTFTIAPAATFTTANIVNTVATTVNFAGFASTLLNMGNSSGQTLISGSVVMPGSLTVSGSVILGDASGDNITFNGSAASSLIPNANNAYDLGSPTLRWRNMYTGDLHLRNERGDWTIIEEADFLSITNNLSGRRYKFVMQEI